MLLEQLLEHAKAQSWLKAGRRQRTDSTYILAAIQRLNRIELVGQTKQHALNEIAWREPEWLKEHTPFEWWDRYAKKLDDYRLPKTETARRQLAEMIGLDGLQLLRMVNQADAPLELASADAVRGRIDWKYALGFELEDAGFHYSVLSEFRVRLGSVDI